MLPLNPMMTMTMRRLPLLAQALILALWLGACGTARMPPLPHLASDATILAFGDSLTYGTGANPGESYPSQLALITGRSVINAGVPGEITEAGRARLPATLDEHHPDLVILCLGGNDMLRHLDAQAMQANLAAMIREVRGRGIPLVLLAVPRPTLFNLKPDPVYAALAQQENLPIENTILATVLADRSKKSDEIHPNAQGYRALAQALAALLQKAGAI